MHNREEAGLLIARFIQDISHSQGDFEVLKILMDFSHTLFVDTSISK